MTPTTRFEVRRATVEVHADLAQLGEAAGELGAAQIRAALAESGRARVIVACAPSQEATMATLRQAADIDWSRVEVLHMDEYVGLPATHPASFRRWLHEHLVDAVRPGQVHELAGDAPDAEAECRRYEELLATRAVDVCFLGFGENGHIAFNDPHVADFDDPRRVKAVTLDARCRAQQVAEGHFPTLEDVPAMALTLTCPALLDARCIVASVPGERKAAAVREAIEGPRTTACPASAVFDHPRAVVFLDRDSAGNLTRT